MSLLMLVLTATLGGVTGFLNVVAGGGSLLSLPFLIFLGLDASSANATNRVAILLQNIVAVWQFRRDKALSMRESLSLAIPASIGAIGGTMLAVQIDERFLKIAIALLISLMAVMLVAKPNMWETHRETAWPAWGKWLLFFGIGVYGGFIQAGVGFLLIWALAGAVGKDLVRANGLKAAIVLCYTIVSFAIFYSRGLVNMEYGLVLAIGSMAGGWIGTRFSVVRGNKWIRCVLVVMVVISAFHMLSGAFSG
ncbi:MAG: sulfite exporter TauE/SafE family protein [Thermovirgaceae bacterium]|nr:sulfite exporter TauE/SafE family protein [Thermovirgaceae bacterium]